MSEHDFGTWLREKRERLNLQPDEVANATGISKVQLHRIENGESGTRAGTVLKLARTLGVGYQEALDAAGLSRTVTAPRTDPELLEAGRNIERSLNAKGMSLREAAGLLGVQVTTLLAVRAGHTALSYDHLTTLARLLNMKPEELTRAPDTRFNRAHAGGIVGGTVETTSRSTTSYKPITDSPWDDSNSEVNRQKQINTIIDLFKRTRQITLLGGEGSGRTYVAEQVGKGLQESMPVYTLTMRQWNPDTQIKNELLRVLRANRQPGVADPEERLVMTIAETNMLLLFDGCEAPHVKQCQELLHVLLKECQNLKVLVTASNPLDLDGELTYRIPTRTLAYTLPASDEPTAATKILLQFAPENYHRSDEDISALNEISDAVQGVPLALSLIGARIGTLTVKKLQEMIEERTEEITTLRSDGQSKDTDREPRFNTEKKIIHSIIQWSVEMLREDEQRTLYHLTFFQDGWEAKAALAVMYDSDSKNKEEINAAELVLNRAMDTLCRYGLITIDRSGENAFLPRYAMPEPVREWARGRRSAWLKEDDVQTRFHNYYLQLARRMRGDPSANALANQAPDTKPDLRRLDRDIENLRTDLAENKARDGEPMGLDLAVELLPFWERRIRMEEGRTWLNSKPDVPDAGRAVPRRTREMRAWALWADGLLASRLSNYDDSDNLLQVSHELFKTLEEEQPNQDWYEAVGEKQDNARVGRAKALIGRALNALTVGNGNEARSFLRDADMVKSHDPEIERLLLYWRGRHAWWDGKLEDAHMEMEKALEKARESKDSLLSLDVRRWIALVQYEQFYLSLRSGKMHGEKALLEKADQNAQIVLNEAMDYGDMGGQAEVSVLLGLIALHGREQQQFYAHSALSDGLGLLLRRGDHLRIAYFLDRIALYFGIKEPRRAYSAGLLIGAADMLREQFSMNLEKAVRSPSLQTLLDRTKPTDSESRMLWERGESDGRELESEKVLPKVRERLALTDDSDALSSL